MAKKELKTKQLWSTLGSPLTWKIFLASAVLTLLVLVIPLAFGLQNFERLILESGPISGVIAQFREIKTELIAIALIVFIISLLLLFAFLTLVLAPLRQITEGIYAILRGGFRKKIAVNSGDELQTLAETLNKMTEKFSEIIEREKTISQMKSDFVSLAAHQLRTPISGIKWALDTILTEARGGISEQHRELLLKSSEKTERVISMIRDLMDVMRIEEGKFGHEAREEMLEPIIQELFQEKLPEAKNKKIAFDLVRSKEPVPPLFIDPQNIRIALETLIDNAIRYTRENGRVNISFLRQDKNVIIAVSDTGIGIPQNELGRIFSKFFRGTQAMRMQTEGNGFGLYIAKNIIERHGGKIIVQSKEREGSTFSIILPIPEKFLGEQEKYKEFIHEF